MNPRISPRSGLAVALLSLASFSLDTAAQIAVSSNDGKAVLVNGANTVPANPADDTVTTSYSNVKRSLAEVGVVGLLVLGAAVVWTMRGGVWGRRIVPESP